MVNLPLVKKNMGLLLKRSTAFGSNTLENGMKKLESGGKVILCQRKSLFV
jgi:hypothetical protein